MWSTIELGRYRRGETYRLLVPQNARNRNGKGSINPIDALIISNEVNDRRFSHSVGSLNDGVQLTAFPDFFFDAVHVMSQDALVVINFLNGQDSSPEGKGIGQVDVAEQHDDKVELMHNQRLFAPDKV